MNNKIVIALIIFSIVLASGVSTTFAKPEYVKNLTEVYGTGSCDTCHRNGSSDGPRTSYGMLFENKTKTVSNVSAAIKAIGAPAAANKTATTTATKTPESTATEKPEVTTAVPTATQASPGFGMIASLVGLFIIAFVVKRIN